MQRIRYGSDFDYAAILICGKRQGVPVNQATIAVMQFEVGCISCPLYRVRISRQGEPH